MKFWGQNIVNEMNELSYSFYDRLENIINRKYRHGEVNLNPTFELSDDVPSLPPPFKWRFKKEVRG